MPTVQLSTWRDRVEAAFQREHPLWILWATISFALPATEPMQSTRAAQTAGFSRHSRDDRVDVLNGKAAN